MKESPRRYTNPFLSDEENEKLDLWNQELEHSNIEHETELYTDKNVMECELPELIICCKESDFQVKDICVDEGIPHGERILFDENDNGILNPVVEPSNDHMNIGDNHDEVTEKKSDVVSGTREIDANSPLNGPISDHRDTGHVAIDTEIKAQDLQNSIPGHKEEVIDSVGPNELKEISKDDVNNVNGFQKSTPDRFIFSSESVTASKTSNNKGPDLPVLPGEEKISSGDNSLDNISTEQAVSNSAPLLEQDRVLPSLKSLLESIDQQPFQTPVNEISEKLFEIGNNTLNHNTSKPATGSLDHVNDPNGVSKLHDMGSDNVAMGEGEPCFSGPIAFSGSISLRSESSTTSTRSFAFPILQNEWNSSPVRMVKADRKRLQKHRGWRHGLLCCRF